MKAITLWQPWASLVACGAKRYETRSWYTKVRGRIAIHAASKSISEVLRTLDYGVLRVMAEALGLESPEHLTQLPTGCVVAKAKLIGCHPIGFTPRTYPVPRPVIHRKFPRCSLELTLVEDRESLFGDYTPGRFAWEFEDVRVLKTPVDAKGQQGIWEWREAS